MYYGIPETGLGFGILQTKKKNDFQEVFDKKIPNLTKN